MIAKYFYKDRVTLNVLAKNTINAKEVFASAEGYALIGVLSKGYPTVKQAVTAMEEYSVAINGAVSVGLGAGDNRQAAIVAEIVKYFPGSHINQVFPAVGATRANLEGNESWINCLVSPTEKVGYVNISTGPHSASESDQAIVPIKAAIALTRDMGGDALKFFPMNGLDCEDEYRAVAIACGEEGFALEPTGGIDKANFATILQIALEANVPKIIPHVYSSIIDQETGETNPYDVQELLEITKKLVDQYE